MSETKTETTERSFIDIFKKPVDNKKIKEIVIPKIQRDYAQGRDNNTKVKRIRDNFLDALKGAISEEGKPINLDFIYGDIDDGGKMTPLDGQQRLTTLFLLHWYAAKKENIQTEDYEVLENFSYETRYSARDFCKELVKFTPSFSKTISEEIEDQEWFPLDWKKDPTISGMLVMLDAIHKKFQGESGIWEHLNNITFDFLPIQTMGLTDELYIKMNSRGKHLTDFERFKAELKRNIEAVAGEGSARDIIRKIDTDWTNLLWGYSTDNYIVDDRFLNYFRFICDMIRYDDETADLKPENPKDIFELLDLYFKGEKLASNIDVFKEYFDCWCNIDGCTGPSEFLQQFMRNSREQCQDDSEEYHSKIVDFFSDDRTKDIFGDCLNRYDKFSLGRKVLLYAITIYLRRQKDQKDVSTKDFHRRIRIINNLIQNSKSKLIDKNIHGMCKDVENIIFNGIGDNKYESFNKYQLSEEKLKEEFLKKHPELTKDLFPGVS